MMSVDCNEETFLASFEFSKFTENLKTPWMDNTWNIELRTESIDNFGVGTNTSKRISLNPLSWKPKRLCSGNKLRLKLCLDLSKGSQKETFCEECLNKLDCSEPRQLLPSCSPFNCSQVNWGVFDAKADLLLPGVEGVFRYKSTLPDGHQLYKTDVGATGRIRKEANRRLVGNVVVGERTFLVDSKFNEVWVESIDCEVTTWSDWSSCSKSCNWGSEPGQSRRGRDVVTQPTFGGASCLDLGQAKTCNQLPCPVNCEVSVWSKWSSCSKSCGGGERVRARSVERKSGHGGIACPNLRMTRTCNDFDCPIDCKVSTWTDWSPCSKSCHWGNIGQSRRARSILVPPQHGGEACPSLDATKTCNDFPCPVDCKVASWSVWSSCSRTCNSGQSKRRRLVETQPQHGGISCPVLESSKTCNEFPCPIDCEVGAWSAWSSCSKSCHWGPAVGQSRRGRAVATSPEHGGAACPALSDARSCNDSPCPVDCKVKNLQ